MLDQQDPEHRRINKEKYLYVYMHSIKSFHSITQRVIQEERSPLWFNIILLQPHTSNLYTHTHYAQIVAYYYKIHGRQCAQHLAAAPALWNSLLVELRVIMTLGVFKSKLKTFLFLLNFTFNSITYLIKYIIVFLFYFIQLHSCKVLLIKICKKHSIN